MCGIAGILNQGPVERPLLDAIRRMIDAMRHRGPDDEGFILGFCGRTPVETDGGPDTLSSWSIAPDYYPKKFVVLGDTRVARVALGHRRLSIIDLSPFRYQPMSTPDRLYQLYVGNDIEFNDDIEAIG